MRFSFGSKMRRPFIIGALTMTMLAAVPVAASAGGSQEPFTGSWRSIDFDGSNQLLALGGPRGRRTPSSVGSSTSTTSARSATAHASSRRVSASSREAHLGRLRDLLRQCREPDRRGLHHVHLRRGDRYLDRLVRRRLDASLTTMKVGGRARNDRHSTPLPAPRWSGHCRSLDPASPSVPTWQSRRLAPSRA